MAEKKNDILTTFTFLATIVVVMCHVDDIFPHKTLPVAILGGTFTDANVHNFFCLSGFFLGKHITEKGWWHSALVKRISTLLVPYVLWSIFYLVASVLMKGTFRATGIRGLNQLFGLNFGSTPQCFPMWYIKTLYLFVFASPVFVWCLMKWRTRLARLTLLLASIDVYIAAKILFPSGTMFRFWSCGGFMLLGFLFFCGGLWLSQVKIKESWRETIYVHPKLVAFAALGAWSASAVLTHFFRAYLYELNILLSSVCLFLIACSIKKIPSLLSRNAFIIYGAHIGMLSGFGRLCLGGGGVYNCHLLPTYRRCYGFIDCVRRNRAPRYANPLCSPRWGTGLTMT